MTHNEKNKSIIETDPETTQMIELVDKATKTTIMNIFHIFEKVDKSLSIVRDMKSISKNPNLITG